MHGDRSGLRGRGGYGGGAAVGERQHDAAGGLGHGRTHVQRAAGRLRCGRRGRRGGTDAAEVHGAGVAACGLVGAGVEDAGLVAVVGVDRLLRGDGDTVGRGPRVLLDGDTVRRGAGVRDPVRRRADGRSRRDAVGRGAGELLDGDTVRGGPGERDALRRGLVLRGRQDVAEGDGVQRGRQGVVQRVAHRDLRLRGRRMRDGRLREALLLRRRLVRDHGCRRRGRYGDRRRGRDARRVLAPGALGARHQQQVVVLGGVLGGVQEGVRARSGDARLLDHACVLRQPLARDLAGVRHAYPSPIACASFRPAPVDKNERARRAARRTRGHPHCRGLRPSWQEDSPRWAVDCATSRGPPGRVPRQRHKVATNSGH